MPSVLRVWGWFSTLVVMLIGGPGCLYAEEREPVALTVAGGVTLGVYEAGYALMFTELLARRPVEEQLVLATGASAGSANALISLINSCSPPVTHIRESLNWQVWVPFSFESFFQADTATSRNMLTRAPIGAALEHVWERWREGLRADCDVILAVSVTRLVPAEVELHPELKVPHQEMKFVLRIRGRGVGRPPAIENYPNPTTHLAQPLLHLRDVSSGGSEADRANFESVRDLLFASSAFPLAFSPQRLRFCLSQPSKGGGDRAENDGACTEPSHEALFIDGGVFDNTPLRLAYRTTTRGLVRRENGWAWDPQGAVDEALSTTPTFLYLNPLTLAYPPLELNAEEEDEETIDFLQVMAGRLIDTARSRELYSLVEEEAALGAHLRLSRNTAPMISVHLGAFFGFFEQDFRVFDFYLGMYDAFVARDIALDVFIQDHDDPSWAPFLCILGWLEPNHVAARASCRGDALENFRILLQVSIDRLSSRCRSVDSPGQLPTHYAALCRRVAEGEPRRVVEGVEDLGEDAFRRGDEDDFAHTMRLLSAYGFHFRDLGLGRSEARYGQVKIRRKILKMVKALVDQQSGLLDRTAVLTAGRAMVNQIAYEPPRDFAYVAAGSTIEAGLSFLPFDWNESWARVHVAAQLRRLLSVVTSDVDGIGVVLMAGAELHPTIIATPTLQPSVGVRLGVQFDSTDAFATDPCTAADTGFDQRQCTQFVIQNYYVITLLERLRLQLTLDFFPVPRAFDSGGVFDVQFGVGYQFF